MSKQTISVNLNPVGLLAILVFIVFLTLKLAGIGVVAGWSWLWVTSPLWLGLALIVGLFVLFLVIAFIVAFFRNL